MLSTIHAIRLLLNFNSGDQKNVVRETTQLAIASAPSNTLDIYSARHKHISDTAIIAFCPMIKDYTRNKRWVNFCQALSACGYKVLVPRLASIEKQELKEDVFHEMAQFYRLVQAHADALDIKSAGVFSVSYTGITSLLASTLLENNYWIKSFMLIGTFSNPLKTFENILNSRIDSDQYTKAVKLRIIANAMMFSKNPDRDLIAALLRFSSQCDPDASPSLIEHVLVNTPEKAKNNFYGIIKRLDQPEHFIRTYDQELKSISQQIRKYADFKKVSASVNILHGLYDQVIPCQESYKLHRMLRRAGKRVRLCVSKLLYGHMDSAIGLKTLGELQKTTALFRSFFAAIRKQ